MHVITAAPKGGNHGGTDRVPDSAEVQHRDTGVGMQHDVQNAISGNRRYHSFCFQDCSMRQEREKEVVVATYTGSLDPASKTRCNYERLRPVANRVTSAARRRLSLQLCLSV